MLRSFIFMLPLSLVLMGCGGLGLDSAAEVRATATLAPPATPRAADTPVAIVRLADTPRAADTPIAPAVAATAKPVVTPLAVLPSFTPQPVATRTPVPTATALTSGEVEEVRAEYVARCKHWALRNMEPVEYSRFEQLNPYDMTDLERVLWGSILVDRERVTHIDNYYGSWGWSKVKYQSEHLEWCQDYWSEPLLERNANKRNHELWEINCFLKLVRYGEAFEDAAENAFENYEDEGMSSVVVNQGIRLLNWMDIDGIALFSMEHKPADLVNGFFRALERDDYDFKDSYVVSDWLTEIAPSEYKEWWTIHKAWGSSDIKSCRSYYPQLFWDRWVPLDNFGVDEGLVELLKDLEQKREDRDWPEWADAKDRDILIRLDRK